jgi:hypothetical protein
MLLYWHEKDCGMKALGFAGMVLVMMAAPALACGGPPICTVKDPTDTPLNVRQAPKGKVLTRLKDGQKVEVIDHEKVGGQRWARIGRFIEGEMQSEIDGGWVFANYLRCKAGIDDLPSEFPADSSPAEISCAVNDPTGTPLNVRADAGSEIVATVSNGTVLRAVLKKNHKGKPWVYVNKWPEDNAIGWVFDPYLKCEEDGGH